VLIGSLVCFLIAVNSVNNLNSFDAEEKIKLSGKLPVLYFLYCFCFVVLWILLSRDFSILPFWAVGYFVFTVFPFRLVVNLGFLG